MSQVSSLRSQVTNVIVIVIVKSILIRSCLLITHHSSLSLSLSSSLSLYLSLSLSFCLSLSLPLSLSLSLSFCWLGHVSPSLWLHVSRVSVCSMVVFFNNGEYGGSQSVSQSVTREPIGTAKNSIDYLEHKLLNIWTNNSYIWREKKLTEWEICIRSCDSTPDIELVSADHSG